MGLNMLKAWFNFHFRNSPITIHHMFAQIKSVCKVKLLRYFK
jgi:hypothetical protein